MPASQSQHEIVPGPALPGGLPPHFSCCCPQTRAWSARTGGRRKRAGDRGRRLVAEASSAVISTGGPGCSVPQAALALPWPAGAAQIWTHRVPAESGRRNYFCTRILNVVVKLPKAFSFERGFLHSTKKENLGERIFEVLLAIMCRPKSYIVY